MGKSESDEGIGVKSMSKGNPECANKLRFSKITLCSAGGGPVPCAVKHLLGGCDSFFHGAEGTAQAPIAAPALPSLMARLSASIGEGSHSS